jgi:hypothetical protein
LIALAQADFIWYAEHTAVYLTEGFLNQQRGVQDDRLREAILSLPDVRSCSVELTPEGGISAIHIVSSSKRPPKQIVRDVESVLHANFGISVDHRKVSVARVREPEGPVRETAPRARLASMTVSTTGGRGRVEVVLERNEVTVSGEAEGVALGGGSLRLIVEAAYNAVEKLVACSIGFEVHDVVRVRCGEREVLVVLASLAREREVISLAGCVAVKDDVQRAAALAALDSCNRLLETLPQIEHIEYEINPADGD